MIDRLLLAALILYRFLTRTARRLSLPFWAVELLTLAFACVAAIVITGVLSYLIR